MRFGEAVGQALLRGARSGCSTWPAAISATGCYRGRRPATTHGAPSSTGRWPTRSPPATGRRLLSIDSGSGQRPRGSAATVRWPCCREWWRPSGAAGGCRRATGCCRTKGRSEWDTWWARWRISGTATVSRREVLMSGGRRKAIPLVGLARRGDRGLRPRRTRSLSPRGLPGVEPRRAGVFVSLHLPRRLACGAASAPPSPTRPSIEEEIVGNAISAASRDPRFYPAHRGRARPARHLGGRAGTAGGSRAAWRIWIPRSTASSCGRPTAAGAAAARPGGRGHRRAAAAHHVSQGGHRSRSATATASSASRWSGITDRRVRSFRRRVLRYHGFIYGCHE